MTDHLLQLSSDSRNRSTAPGYSVLPSVFSPTLYGLPLARDGQQPAPTAHPGAAKPGFEPAPAGKPPPSPATRSLFSLSRHHHNHHHDALMDLTTTTYQQETPGWLWRAFTQGPAAEYDRYDERITRLIAVDVLVHCREDLTERERRFAIELATEVHYVDVDV